MYPQHTEIRMYSYTQPITESYRIMHKCDNGVLRYYVPSVCEVSFNPEVYTSSLSKAVEVIVHDITVTQKQEFT